MISRLQLGWLLSGSILLVSTGCDVNVHKCKGNDDPQCDFGDFGDGDGDTELDGSTKGDAATDADSGPGDGGPRGDGGPLDDGGLTGQPLTISEFCKVALAPALSWDAKLDLCCVASEANGSKERDRILSFFGFPPTGVTACEAQADSANITFVEAKAEPCAKKLAAFYNVAPPANCPSGEGFFLPELEATVGHGAQHISQIPECRAAFVGKIKLDDPCTSDLECADGRTCKGAPGGGNTCQAPLTGGICTAAADCAPGYVCKGSTLAAGRTCVSKESDLGVNGGACTGSSECPVGSVCAARDVCAAPPCALICRTAPAASTYSDTGESCESFECQGYCDTTSDSPTSPPKLKCAPLCAQ